MGIILKNALLVDIDPTSAEKADLRIEGTRIAERAHGIDAQPNDESVDCRGAVVLPGCVNGHTHLYSALAVGMPPPPKQPQNFLQILQYIWWRLDRALDAQSIECSAKIGGLEALRCGTTTLIDHHASPQYIEGSLDLIEEGLSQIGIRGVLCYETTDRNGRDGKKEGLEENRRYLQKCQSRFDHRFAAMVGAHAAFTLEDDSLDAIGQLVQEHGCGVHIHVAEDPCDDALCQKQYGAALLNRLHNHGLIRDSSIFAHGIHLNADAMDQLKEAGVTLAHNVRSNMNNSVGFAKSLWGRSNAMLGTDGIGSDMFAEAKTAWFAARHHGAPCTPDDVINAMALASRRASRSLDIPLGRLHPGAAADVVLTDYVPATPLADDNVAGHLLFAITSAHVRDVLIDGQWAMRDRQPILCDEHAIRAEASHAAARLWKSIESFPL